MPHIHEKYDFAIGVYIIFDNKVLLVNHPRYGKWIPPGGHIELDEDPDQTLIREAKEETGLDIEVLSTKSIGTSPENKALYRPAYMEVHEANTPHKHITLMYFAKAKSNDAVKSDEHSDMKWFTPEELEEPKYKLNDEIKHYSVEAIKAARAT